MIQQPSSFQFTSTLDEPFFLLRAPAEIHAHTLSLLSSSAYNRQSAHLLAIGRKCLPSHFRGLEERPALQLFKLHVYARGSP
jgi:hypothetical protein